MPASGSPRSAAAASDAPSSSTRSGRSSARRRDEVPVQELPDYCARPACRRAFTRVIGPGRPQAFCSEVCRRAAEKELRQARSMLAHFEDLTAQLRVDIAAFGRGGLGSTNESNEAASATTQAAAAAVHRAGGVLAFLGDNDDPLARELRALHAAVSPVIVDQT